jgi:hypothetical protein
MSDRREEITAVIFGAQQDTAALQTPDIPDDVYWLNIAAAAYLALTDGGYLPAGDVLAMIRRERDAAHRFIRALRRAGHIPDGPWTRRANGLTGLESESDIEDAAASADLLAWEIEHSDG